MTEKEPKKLGRPKKYFTKEEHDQAQKLYLQRWYNTNKEYVKENRDLVREKEKRHLRTNSGYFGIYSGNDMYIAYSKDIASRARDIIKNIERQEKNTTFYNKFDSTKTYNWRILAFAQSPDDNILDGVVTQETHQTHPCLLYTSPSPRD